MNEKAGVRKKLKRALGGRLPEAVWGNEYVRGVTEEYLSASSDAEREDSWDALEQGARERLDLFNAAIAEHLRGVKNGTHGGSPEMREAEERDTKGSGQGPKGNHLPKATKPLGVARFVYERDRLDGYREPAPWTEWVKQWNDERPGHRIRSASNFRTYFLRGDKAVQRLNFDWPSFESSCGGFDTT